MYIFTGKFSSFKLAKILDEIFIMTRVYSYQSYRMHLAYLRTFLKNSAVYFHVSEAVLSVRYIVTCVVFL